MRANPRSALVAIAATGLCLIAPAAASAAAPLVTTGGAAQVTISSATLTGTVNPRGLSTSYYFQYGTTTAYGSRTASTAAGKGGAGVAAAAQISGLGSNTKYHYRLIAHNSDGTTAGNDRTFRTPRQPLGLALSATPNPVVFGGLTTLSGTLSGTGNTGRAVQLQQNPFPFTSGFSNVANAQLTDAAGNFSFTVLSVPLTTQYRVLVASNQAIVSPVVTVSVQVLVRTSVTHRHVRRGAKVRFSGTVRPAVPNVPLAIQKRGPSGGWVTVSGSITRPGGNGYAVYGKTVRVKRGGRYRVYVGATGGTFTPNVGRTIVIHTFR
ncbi:MAG TPA: hypothetical protein VK510_00395 [Solirubrobacteraceae bacterium]|nr:hypothetical protein [Solirubrobacteraceae bacterium]